LIANSLLVTTSVIWGKKSHKSAILDARIPVRQPLIGLSKPKLVANLRQSPVCSMALLLLLLLLYLYGFGVVQSAFAPCRNSTHKHDNPERWWELLGGEEQFYPEMERISQHASSLRNGMNCNVTKYNYFGNGLIAQLCFDDGVCWALKVIENARISRLGRELGIAAMEVLSTHCPELPIPRYHGGSRCLEDIDVVCYYFMDWIEGRMLLDAYEEHKSEIIRNGKSIERFELNVTIPNTVVTQLGSFVYNLTTCPIPAEKSTRSKYSAKRYFSV
jgi:hypothetical protein